MIYILYYILKMVIYMKSVLSMIFFCVGTLILSILFFVDTEESISTMLQEDNYNEYQVFTVYTDNLTTKNFNKYFSSSSQFLTIYPKINPLYQDKLGNIYFSCSNNCNLNEFINYYKKVLETNNLKNDLTNIDYYGVSISKVKIYSTKIELEKILRNCHICALKE